jgi:hypothetical protein
MGLLNSPKRTFQHEPQTILQAIISQVPACGPRCGRLQQQSQSAQRPTTGACALQWCVDKINLCLVSLSTAIPGIAQVDIGCKLLICWIKSCLCALVVSIVRGGAMTCEDPKGQLHSFVQQQTRTIPHLPSDPCGEQPGLPCNASIWR